MEPPSESSELPDFTARLLTAYRKMAASIERVFADDSDHPKLVIAIDEAQPLTPVHNGTYRPADVFCRVINEYSHDQNHSVWVVFASTTSKVADFSLPNQKRLCLFSIVLISQLIGLQIIPTVLPFGARRFSRLTLNWDGTRVRRHCEILTSRMSRR